MSDRVSHDLEMEFCFLVVPNEDLPPNEGMDALSKMRDWNGLCIMICAGKGFALPQNQPGVYFRCRPINGESRRIDKWQILK